MINTTLRTGRLTEQEIHRAADAIAARGEEATQHAVRTECGKRGSMATINKYLSIWRGIVA